MDVINATILGLIQGLAEALPISSSAHLALYKYFANATEVPMLFDVLLHVATLFAVLVVFRKRIGELLASFFRFVTRRTRKDDAEHLTQIATILLASAVTAIVGFALKDLVKNLNVRTLPIGFCITGALLIISGNSRLKKIPNILRTAAILGIVQGVAVFPGISRLGSTISILLMLGFAEENAGEFSFILSIPAVLGASLLEGMSAYKHGLWLSMGTLPVACGMLSAFLLCLMALKLFLYIIKSRRLAVFAFYLFSLAIFLQTYFVFWNA